MNIAELLAQAEEIAGQVVNVQGSLIIFAQDTARTAYIADLSSRNADLARIRISHSFAELRRLIQPMQTVQLAHRGQFIQLPYEYAFPVCIQATVGIDGDRLPVLSNITRIESDFPYPGKWSEYAGNPVYHYAADITYHDPVPLNGISPARARIQVRRDLQFAQQTPEALMLAHDENRYAGSLLNQPLMIPGTLTYLPGLNAEEYHFVLLTHAIRTTRVAFGLPAEMAAIWLRPSGLDKVLLTQIERRPAGDPLEQPARITGTLAWLNEEIAPILSDNPPKLVFTHLSQVTLYSETLLI